MKGAMIEDCRESSCFFGNSQSRRTMIVAPATSSKDCLSHLTGYMKSDVMKVGKA
jgi:hypothetical protein